MLFYASNFIRHCFICRLTVSEDAEIEPSVGNLSPDMGARKQVGIGLYRPASLWLGYSIPDSVPGIDSSPHSEVFVSGQLRLGHWLSDALTTRLDLIQININVQYNVKCDDLAWKSEERLG
jgi:hypothetical protein